MTFKLSDLWGIGDRQFPALGLVDLAIREGTFCEAMDLFLAAVQDCASEESASVGCMDVSIPSREVILEWLQLSYLEGTIEDFFAKYFSLLEAQFPDIHGSSLSSYAEEITRLIENSLIVGSTGLPRKTLLSPSDHYLVLLRYHGHRLHTAATFLSPVIYWLHQPFSPYDCADKLLTLITSMISSHIGAISESSIRLQLFAKGVVVRPHFLSLLLANDTQVAIGKMSEKSVVWWMKDKFPRFDFAAYHLDERNYLDINQNYQLPTDDEAGYVEIRGLIARQTVVRRFFTTRSHFNDFEEIDWVDMAYKLACTRHGNYEPIIQGIGGTLHAAIVEQLRIYRRAMRLDELQSALGIDFDLSPEMLGPAIGNGMIMAYARHPRFLDRHEAFYVLSDFVETDTEKKGRISRDRIVTPWVEKDWNFSLKELVSSIEEDPIYGLVGLVLLRRIVTKLTLTLPAKPYEPYFVRKMTERAKMLLDERGMNLGRGAYALQADWQDFFDQANNLCADDTTRIRLISHRLGSPSNLKKTISSILDSGIREELLALI